MLNYNSPQHIKQRQESKPLTLKENEQVIEYLNNATFNKSKVSKGYELLQRLIYNYEKMQYREAISQRNTADLEVEYEYVESKMNNYGK